MEDPKRVKIFLGATNGQHMANLAPAASWLPKTPVQGQLGASWPPKTPIQGQLGAARATIMSFQCQPGASGSPKTPIQGQLGTVRPFKTLRFSANLAASGRSNLKALHQSQTKRTIPLEQSQRGLRVVISISSHILRNFSVLAGGRCPPDLPNFGWGGKAPRPPLDGFSRGAAAPRTPRIFFHL